MARHAACTSHVGGWCQAEPAVFACRYTLHIIDLDPQSVSANGWLEDVRKVKKYEMSDEDYNKRHDTFRKYKEGKVKARVSAPLE